MILAHYSASPLEKIRDAEQFVSAEMKPRGLWVSVEGNDDGWREWCGAEGFAPERLLIRQRIYLTPAANILTLNSATDIDDFDKQYGRSSLPSRFPDRHDYGAWQAVARSYDGIIIAPFIWERRLSGHCTWYYSWDCASGCIWRKRAIAAVEPWPMPSEAAE